MKKKFKIPLVILIFLIIIIIILIAMGVLKNTKEETKVKVLDSIDNYGYTLDERDSKLMKDTYNELKETLKAKDINEEEYAKNIAKLFVIDLFTLDNKINKYDVGSVEYVYPDVQENYKLNVEDTIYKIILNNSNGKRKQDLPKVKSVEVTDFKVSKFQLNEEELDSFEVSIKWDYEKNLGYDDKAIITLVKKNQLLYVVEYVVMGDANV